MARDIVKCFDCINASYEIVRKEVWSEIENNGDLLIALFRVKKNQLDAQLIFSIFPQPLHVSGVFRPIIRRYNRMYTTIGTYYSL